MSHEWNCDMMWSISYALSFQIILPEHLSQPLNQLKQAISEPGMKAEKYALVIFASWWEM